MTNINLITDIIGERAATALCHKFKTLTELAKADVAELQQVQGVSPSSARKIKAALEIASRLSREVLGESPVLDQPEQVVNFLREDVRPYSTEVFQVLLLNTRRRLIRVCQVATGTLDTVLVHSREVFKAAITANAAAIILVHNHPSGDPTPSDADVKVTRDLIRAGQLLKIEVLDHLIIGSKTENRAKDYSSLRELGYFYS